MIGACSQELAFACLATASLIPTGMGSLHRPVRAWIGLQVAARHAVERAGGEERGQAPPRTPEPVP